jgi:hypothetical protein
VCVWETHYARHYILARPFSPSAPMTNNAHTALGVLIMQLTYFSLISQIAIAFFTRLLTQRTFLFAFINGCLLSSCQCARSISYLFSKLRVFWNQFRRIRSKLGKPFIVGQLLFKSGWVTFFVCNADGRMSKAQEDSIMSAVSCISAPRSR